MPSSRRLPGPDAIVVVLLLAVHFALHPFFVRWPWMPNLLVGSLLIAALRLRAGHAALLGFALGVLEAAMSLEGLGSLSVVLTLVGYLGARSRDLLFADARHYVAVYLFVGTWVAEIGIMLAMPGGPGWVGSLAVAPVSAVGTALVCGAAEAAASAFRRL